MSYSKITNEWARVFYLADFLLLGGRNCIGGDSTRRRLCRRPLEEDCVLRRCTKGKGFERGERETAGDGGVLARRRSAAPQAGGMHGLFVLMWSVYIKNRYTNAIQLPSDKMRINCMSTCKCYGHCLSGLTGHQIRLIGAHLLIYIFKYWLPLWQCAD